MNKMEILGYTTSTMSWFFIFSVIKRLRSTQGDVNVVDLNIEAPPCAVMCSVALEAFSNEISSLSGAFTFSVKKDFKNQYLQNEELDSELQKYNCTSREL
jgi:hypothetical protein